MSASEVFSSRSTGALVRFVIGATDYTAAEVFDIDHGGHQLVIDIRHQQIGAWNRPVKSIPQFINEMIERAWDIDLGVKVGLAVQHGQRFAVEIERDAGKPAVSDCPNIIWALEIDANRYPKGVKVTDRQMLAVDITRDQFHGEWNYTISPNQQPP